MFAVVASAAGTSYLTTKEMLIGFSSAIEQECRGGLDGAHLFGAFQREEYYEYAQQLWGELAAQARSTYVFAQFNPSKSNAPTHMAFPSVPAPVKVELDADSILRREWFIVVDRPRGAMALAALERSGQEVEPESDRLFDSTWTTDPLVVRRAARICALIARQSRSHGADAVMADLAGQPPQATADHVLRERLLVGLLARIDPSARPFA